MATLQENINQAIADFDSIEKSIIDNGISVPLGTDTSAYSGLINQACKKQYDEGYQTGFNDNSPEAVVAQFEAMIDESGVLDSTEGELTEKVEQLLLYSKLLKYGTTFTLNKACDIEIIPFYLDFDYARSFIDLFRDNQHIKKIKGINTAKANSLVRMFLTSTIEEIEMPFDFSGVTSYAGFAGTFQCSFLKEIRVVAGTIKFSIAFTSAVLSSDSIQSIIDGLATVEKAQTLTLNSAVLSKLTEEQWAIITAKNWTAK